MFRRAMALVWVAAMLGLVAAWVASWQGPLVRYVSTDRFCVRLTLPPNHLQVDYDGGPEVLSFKGMQMRREFAGAKLEIVPGGWVRAGAVVPLWMMLTLWLLAGGAAKLILQLRDRRRKRSGACLQCGYDLRGSVSERCSECGALLSKVANG
jgi:hypothetical protein